MSDRRIHHQTLAMTSANPIDAIVRATRQNLTGQSALTADSIDRALTEEVGKRIDAGEVTAQSESELLRHVRAEISGFGPLQPLLDDPTIEEIWINSPNEVFVARSGVSQRTNLSLEPGQIRELVERMLRTTHRRVDLSTPFVDASLPDGSRLHVVIPDITRRHWSVNIRKFSQSIVSMSDLVDRESLTMQAAEFIRMCVLARANILVSGATQAGKTTLLNALLSCAREGERIVTVEETFELDVRVEDVVSMQCRQPNLEGTGDVNLRRLIKEALRMRPDRLVVGEVREAESLDLLIALNSGLPGACSIHANSASDALTKLCTLPLLAGRNIDAAFVQPTVAGCIDVVIHCELDRFGSRRVREIVMPTGRIIDGVVEVVILFERRNGALVWSGLGVPRLNRFELAGLDPDVVLHGDPA